jgi:hypothetical protein
VFERYSLLDIEPSTVAALSVNDSKSATEASIAFFMIISFVIQAMQPGYLNSLRPVAFRPRLTTSLAI